MGRKTFDSVGKPLPKRRNIVVTRQDITIPGCEVVKSIEDGFQRCAKSEDEVFIVGGAEIYRLAMPLTDRIYLNHYSSNALMPIRFFPEIDKNEWKEVKREDFDADEKTRLSVLIHHPGTRVTFLAIILFLILNFLLAKFY